MRYQPFFARVALFLGAVAPTTWAVAPSVSTILPRGGQRGNVVEVDFHGGNLGDAVDLMFHEAGITLAEMGAVEAGKVHCKLQIAPDCRLGTHAIRVRTKSGISNLCLFSVGALPETFETEPNNERETAPIVSLGTTLNGEITAEDIDYFAVDVPAGGRLSAEVEAIRLAGQLFDVKLRLFDPEGRELIAADDTPLMRQDAAFVHLAQEAGKYVLAVSEAAYGGGGGFYYRLHLGQFPRPLAVTPMGGQPGAEIRVKWLGDPGLAEQTVATPADAPGSGSLTAASDLGVCPTGVPFRYSSLPETLETEPNNDQAGATPGQAPGAFDGVIEAPGDVDWFKFDGTQGQVFDVRVYAREMGSPLDSVLNIYSPSGGGLSGVDDAVGLDAQTRVTLAETGTHTFSIRDHLGSGGATHSYRVEIVPVTPTLKFGFAENEPASLTVPAGNRGFFLLTASKADFDGPLGLSFENLPQGLTADFDEFPAGHGVIPVVLSATPDAPMAGALLGINGQLKQDGADVKGHIDHDVVMIYGDNRVTFFARNVQHLATAVAEPAPFQIDLVPPKAPLVQNGTMNLKVVATRAEGYTAPISLRIPWLPPGVGAATADIPEGGTETTLFVNASGGAGIGTWRLAAVGTSGGYQVSTALTPLTIEAPWVTFDVTKAETEQGKPTQLVVNVAQAKSYEGSFQAELLGLPKGATSQPQPITKDTTQLTFPIEVAADAPAGKFQGIFVRAILAYEGEDVLHQWGNGALNIYEPLPPELQQQAPPPQPETPQPEQPARRTRFASNQ